MNGPMVEHKKVEEAIESYSRACSQAVGSGHWMAAVWKVENGKLTLVTRTCWEFETGNFAGAVDQLRENLDRQLVGMSPSEVPKMLPMAQFLKESMKKAAEKERAEAMQTLPLKEPAAGPDKVQEAMEPKLQSAPPPAKPPMPPYREPPTIRPAGNGEDK